jgi:hypothetical protein
MKNSLVSMYEKGAITADHLVAQYIHMVNPDHPVRCSAIFQFQY